MSDEVLIPADQVHSTYEQLMEKFQSVIGQSMDGASITQADIKRLIMSLNVISLQQHAMYHLLRAKSVCSVVEYERVMIDKIKEEIDLFEKFSLQVDQEMKKMLDGEYQQQEPKQEEQQ